MEIEREVDHVEEKEVTSGSDDEDDEEEGNRSSSSSSFIPSIRIKRMEDHLILISTVVVKDVALTSDLFQLLEDEKLDIASESQYRTETRVAHTVQVKVPEGYDVDALEKKLCAWAGKAPNVCNGTEQDPSSPTLLDI
ncbi:hypothetical protein Syun_000713 [Stephania yunnanensis]|uniref:Uncharacterized protein n=1 Tax=Stephania yunnanensis TaxID=152371 RepID=A0AAP0LDM0_9MAGN